MSAMSELAAAGASFVPAIGETVAYMPRDGAPSAYPWTVAGYRRADVSWRLQGPAGTYVDASPDELFARIGRPHALELAAAIAPLHEWPRDELAWFLEIPGGAPCSECGRPRMGGAS